MTRDEALSVLGLQGAEDRFQVRAAALRADEQLAHQIDGTPEGPEKERLRAQRPLIETALNCLLDEATPPSSAAPSVEAAQAWSQSPRQPSSNGWLVGAAVALAMVATVIAFGTSRTNARLEQQIEKLRADVDNLGKTLDPIPERLVQAEAERQSLRRAIIELQNRVAELAKPTAPAARKRK